jgi:NADPH:quinone reductase-like Zn-dependent oxidoreductase
MTETMSDPTMAAATMNETMRAVSQDELGGPEVLKVVSLPRPEPGLSEILVRVHAAGVNPIDGAQCQTGAFVGPAPFVLGWDVSGTVEAVGLGVTLYEPGDEVFAMLPFPQGHGAYAEFVVGPTRVFVRKPDRLDHVHAAAMPMAGLTAWQALVDTAAIGEGSRVLIIGAAGGIGHLGRQIAKARGAHVTALASAANHDFVRSLGADDATTPPTSPKPSATRMPSWTSSAAITPSGRSTSSGPAGSWSRRSRRASRPLQTPRPSATSGSPA